MGDSRIWSREFMTQFIDLYKSFPCLWKIKSKEYTNRNLKNMAYDKLANFCKSINPDANRDYVVKRIQSFRGSFRKELKKVEDSKRSGAGTEEVYTPSLWYFDLLLFTLDQELPTQSVSNIEKPEFEEEFREESSQEYREGTEDDDDLEGKNHEQISAGSSTSDQHSKKQAVPKKRSRTSIKNKTHNDFIIYCKRQSEKSDSLDEYDAAAISWAKKLRRMNPIQAIYADMYINRFVNMGLLNQLTNNTDLLPQSPIFSFLSSHSGETSNLSFPAHLPTPYSVPVHPPNATSDSSQSIQPSGVTTYYEQASENILNL